MSTGFSPASPYYRPYRGMPPYGAYPVPSPTTGSVRYATSAYAGTAYPSYRLSQLKQQMGTRVINTSREPVTLAQLTGKRDGDPVSAHVFVTPHYTGVAAVDGAMQRAGSVVGYVPQALGNFVSASKKGALVGGGGAFALTGGWLLIGKMLGKFKGWSWAWMLGGSALAGFGGVFAGGVAGFVKAGFDTLLALKDIALGKR